MTQKPLECSENMFIKHLVKLYSRHVDCILYYCCSYCHDFVCKCTLVGASGLKAINKHFEHWTWQLRCGMQLPIHSRLQTCLSKGPLVYWWQHNYTENMSIMVMESKAGCTEFMSCCQLCDRPLRPHPPQLPTPTPNTHFHIKSHISSIKFL